MDKSQKSVITVKTKIDSGLKPVKHNVFWQVEEEVKLKNVDILKKNKEEELIKVLQKFNRVWLEKFLEKAKILVQEFNLDGNNLQVKFSVPKNQRSLLPITIGKNRYALVSRYDFSIALIMPLGFHDLINQKDADKILFEETFNSNKKGNDPEAMLIVFKDLDLSDKVFELWKKACAEEFSRNYLVPHRQKDHNPYFYKLITNKEYRNYILNQIF